MSKIFLQDSFKEFCEKKKFELNYLKDLINKNDKFYDFKKKIEDNEAPIKAAKIQKVVCALAADIFAIPKLI